MLHAAGVVARDSMPKLRTMEIWSGGRGHASVFRYHVPTDDFTTLTWRSYWNLRLGRRVIDIWKEVALKSTGHELRVKVCRIPIPSGSNSIRGHGDAIDLLDLKQEVLHPVSLRQIQLEGRHCHSN